MRERLANRRPSETFGFECADLKYTATASWFDDGRLGEIFLAIIAPIPTPTPAPRTRQFSPAFACSSVPRSMFFAGHCFATHKAAPVRRSASYSTC